MIQKLICNLYARRKSISLVAVIALLWSWLFLINVARISESILVGYIIILIVYVLIVGVSSAVIWFMYKYFQISRTLKHSRPQAILKIILLWAFTEWAVSWLVAAIFMGKGGSWDSLLPFSSLTPFIMFTPLKFLTRYFGYFGTSALVGTGLLIVFSKSLRKYILGYWLVLIVFTLCSWSLYKNPTGPNVVATIVAQEIDKPTKVTLSDSRVVVLPEYGFDDIDSKTISKKLSTKDETYFVGSKQNVTTAGNTNLLIFGSTTKGFIDEIQKSRLIPGGEYLAWPFDVGLRTFSPNIHSDFTVRRLLSKGHEPLKPLDVSNGVSLGSAVCSSIIAPQDYRHLSKEGATVLTNSASLDIFRGSRILAIQHRGLATFMATANARPYLQSSNNWPAFALNHNGRLLAEIHPANSLNVNISSNSQRTPYTLVGEWVAWLGATFIAFITFRRLLRRKRQLSGSRKVVNRNTQKSSKSKPKNPKK